SSLAGLSPLALEARALGDFATRPALADLTPFSIGGVAPDPALALLSPQWLAARSEFLSQLLESRTVDRAYALSGTTSSSLFVDADQDERLSALSPLAAAGALSHSGTEAALQSYLDGLTYGSETYFGVDDAGQPDNVTGTAGADRLLGNAGNDILSGSGGA